MSTSRKDARTPEPFTDLLRKVVQTPVVCGWDVHGEYCGQDAVVVGWLEGLGIKPLSLGVTKDGHPRHPLYVPYSADLIEFP